MCEGFECWGHHVQLQCSERRADLRRPMATAVTAERPLELD